MNQDSTTSVSLLARLRNEPDNKRGWDEFVSRYHPKVVVWCRRWGLQSQDAEDVSQNVMLELSQQLQRFEYDPSGRFRGWLKTVARRAWYDYSCRRKKLEFQADDSGIWEVLCSQQAEDDLLAGLEAECNRELMEIAMARVKSRVKPNTWQAFHLTEVKRLSTDDVQSQLNMSKGGIYVARARVQKMLMEEVKLLDQMPEHE